MGISSSTHTRAFERRLKLGIALAAGVVVLLFALVRGADLWWRRDLALAAGERRAAGLALILSAYLRETYSAADASLRQLAIHSQRVGGPRAPAEAWDAALASAWAGLTAVGSLTVTDAEGTVRYSTQSLIVGQSRRDQFVFQRLSSDPRDVLIVDTPFASRRDPRLVMIPLGRRLIRRDGTFDGIVVATLIPDQLRQVFRQVDVGSGWLWVFHPSGQVLLREPSPASRIGETAAGNPVFDATRAGRTAGTIRSRLVPDGPMLLSAFRSLEEPPLSVAVSLDQGEVLADWRREAIVSAGTIALLGLGAALFLPFVFRLIDRRTVAEQALARSQRLEAIGQFTGGVAHDFNNMLTVIMGNVSLLRGIGGQERPGHDRPELAQIEHAAGRAAELTHRLLAFARRQPLHPQVVDLNSLVGALRPILSRLMSEAITLKIVIEPSPCFARIDAVQVETALMNLCANARDAMATGGLLVIETGHATLDEGYARLNADVAPGQYVVVSVSDTGIGIPPEDVVRVLEPFFTTKPLGKGTGLGLSMVYGFVKQSGGHMKIYSEIGHGTVVKLFFPEAQAPHTADAIVPPVEALEARDETVLVVEDEEGVRDLVVTVLRSLGYTVLAAGDAKQARAVASEHPDIDLLFTDVVLPNGIGGLELAAQLEAERPGLRILFTSGYSEDFIARPERVTADRRLISKPYSKDDLARAVRAALDAPPTASADLP